MEMHEDVSFSSRLPSWNRNKLAVFKRYFGKLATTHSIEVNRNQTFCNSQSVNSSEANDVSSFSDQQYYRNNPPKNSCEEDNLHDIEDYDYAIIDIGGDSEDYKTPRHFKCNNRAQQPDLVSQSSTDSASNECKILRGKFFIKNRLRHSHSNDDVMENVNVFDSCFCQEKQNPVYHSDPDIHESLDAEHAKLEQSKRLIGEEVTQDITYDTVNRIATEKTSEHVLSQRNINKQYLSTVLLSRLSNIDSKDFRQTLMVKHHHEDVFGDVLLMNANGGKANSARTTNCDSVNENVELILKGGKAFVIIQVVAERIVPIGMESNAWRKSQAIVTRNIEIDLLANEQRRRLYNHMMKTNGRFSVTSTSEQHLQTNKFVKGNDIERHLTSMETLQIFSEILETADASQKDAAKKHHYVNHSKAPVFDMLY